jgi:hypothetical protein
VWGIWKDKYFSVWRWATPSPPYIGTSKKSFICLEADAALSCEDSVEYTLHSKSTQVPSRSTSSRQQRNWVRRWREVSSYMDWDHGLAEGIVGRQRDEFVLGFACHSTRMSVWRRAMIALMMEEVSTSETSVNIYQTKQRNIPENSHPHNQEIPLLLWNTILSLINSVHSLTYYFFKINFNIVLRSKTRSLKWFLPFRSSD